MLVMGIGNVLMQDDGIGVYLTQELMAENTDGQIRFEIGETDVDYCLAQVEENEFLIIIDAVQCRGEKGSLYVFELTELGRMEKGIAAHNYHLFHALSKKQGILIGIEPYEIGFHFGLSAELNGRFPFIKEKVSELIHNIAAAKCK
ncbi:hydrogenase maturation protease [Mesobacillus subterraneus]|uniref:hydrogenase maturation protease n=1 Tax=Mesobacillus subterraneus TaxID=285983 RepID=UPI00203CCD99|nr:hydrogenase maturation protease [Mesobacillus subterraneus]MCM3682244.1 hydrogenase maturation protease [Mesobacillus subterraneus]